MENQVADFDIKMTRRSLELASKGIGLVSPNPPVGCVIVSAAGEIVGEGTYIYDNIVHAEAIALEQAGELARGGTAYVSLEPHNHHGRTPPCTEALINAGIKRVVSPIADPNPKVAGSGFDRLRAAGVEVVTGIMADEAVRLIEPFICWHIKQRPFVHLKLAMSLDGRISLNNSVSTALSGELSRSFVQDLRHENDAILVGGNTAAVDDPSLTDRSGKPRRRKLLRVIPDNRLQTPVESNLVQTARETPTLFVSNSKDEQKIGKITGFGGEVFRSDARDLDVLLSELYKRDIQSLLVEGGTQIAGSFIDARLVDKVTFVIAQLIIGGSDAPVAIGGRGVADISDAMKLKEVTTIRLGEDIVISGYPSYEEA